ncbi:response regulator transcription factor [Gilvimarinus chinensis]|uniref:response regulator transcription factor n=1 Tax=Gilvimarinus chinensis TaxID=396005 RepID=UPI00037DBC0C|nr:response regulator transcription factor [Gilvimarinus chinensis]
MTHIQIIDDDKDLGELLQEYLSQHGYEVACSHDGREGLEAVLTKKPDLVLLDVMMPELNGFDVLKQLRQKSHVPVLMLTARGDEIDRVLGLELGADDYVAKPFSHRELVARIQAILRRLNPPQNDNSTLQLTPERLEASFYGEPLDLTAAEFRVLSVLYETPGEIVSKDDICQQAFGRRLQQFDRHIDIHISHIRKKMADINPTDTIKTVRGSGYQLLVNP